ncbi:hypothetical protein ACS0TY_018665 [Phlomoides rotata]
MVRVLRTGSDLWLLSKSAFKEKQMDIHTKLMHNYKQVPECTNAMLWCVEEQVAIFLSILAHHKKNKVVKFKFLRSGQTVSHYVHLVLGAVLELHCILLAKPVPIPDDCTDPRWKWFKGCLGALDGRYINVQVHAADKGRYRTQKGHISTNVLVVCNRDMRFIYVLPGWEGSACDARILRNAVNRTNGLKVPVDMDSTQPTPVRGKENAKKTNCGSRRMWTTREEQVLINALKDLVLKGQKTNNGFRSGYLMKLEMALRVAFPTTDLQANPHIVSKLTTWKRSYGLLVTALGTTGVGHNTLTNQLDCTYELWEVVVKKDPAMKGIRYKEWPLYPDWIEIFGRDRATGEVAGDVLDAAKLAQSQSKIHSLGTN